MWRICQGAVQLVQEDSGRSKFSPSCTTSRCELTTKPDHWSPTDRPYGFSSVSLFRLRGSWHPWSKDAPEYYKMSHKRLVYGLAIFSNLKLVQSLSDNVPGASINPCSRSALKDTLTAVPSYEPSLSSKLELHLGDGRGGVKPFRACACAVEDGVATIETQLVLHLFLAVSLVGVLYDGMSGNFRANIL